MSIWRPSHRKKRDDVSWLKGRIGPVVDVQLADRARNCYVDNNAAGLGLKIEIQHGLNLNWIDEADFAAIDAVLVPNTLMSP